MTDAAAPIPVLDDLTDAERELVDCARRGAVLVRSELDVDALAVDADPAHEVRAELIRELLLGRRGELDPRGVRMRAAHVTGELDLRNVRATVGVELADCVITEPILASEARLASFGLPGSLIAGLEASGVRIDANLDLRRLRLTGSAETGTVRLVNARVGEYLLLDDAEIANASGPVLAADGIRVEVNVRMSGARLRGSGEHGAVRLHTATVGGLLIADDVRIGNASGPALTADGVRVGADARFEDATLTGSDEAGTMRLPGARIDGHLDLEGAEIVGTDEERFAVDLEDATAGGMVFFPDMLMCATPGRGRCPRRHQVELAGFTYGALPRIGWEQWLHLIRHHTPEYRPAAYQQLAAVERAAGHEGNARRILIAQQRDLYERNREAIGGWPSQRFHALWGLLAGYGYRARRTAAALLLALVAAGGLGLVAGQVSSGDGHRAAERPASFTAPAGMPCTPVELIGVGLDRGLPLSPTGIRARCDLDTGRPAGQWFTVAVWVVQAAVWGLATLALAGYTWLVRKPA